MNKSISFLLIGGLKNERELVLEQLNRAEFQTSSKCVSANDELRKTLRESDWDLVLSSQNPTEPGALKALEITNEHSLDVPFIFLADNLSPEEALSAYNAGAHDIVYKDAIHRLIPVIKRELQTVDIKNKYKRQKEIAEEIALAGKFKSRFMATLSHEMRTTLNTIVLLSKLLAENRDSNLNDNQLEYANVIYESGNSLLELLNKVLDISKIKSGKMNILLEELEIGILCNKMERMFLPQAREKGVSFSCKKDKAVVDKIISDRTRIEQILINLLSNALKFTDEGSVTLDIYTPDKEETDKIDIQDENVLAFQVEDTGIGIPADKQDSVFESFTQVNNDRPEKYLGTGLGLTICKEITEILGGKITLKSNEGTGSIFTLFLPADSSKSVKNYVRIGKVELHEEKVSGNFGALESLEKYPKVHNGKNHKVLIVDDSKMHRLALRDFIGSRVKQCITAETAEETYKLLETEDVGCLVLDLHLPDADGYEVLTRIKNQEQFLDLPVIIYTGKHLSAEEENELKKYADSVVYKKVESYKVLINKVTTYLTKAQQN